MNYNFILNRKHKIIAAQNNFNYRVDIPVIFTEKNIFIDGNKIGKRKWKSIMLEIENREDLLENNFVFRSYCLDDNLIRKVERSMSSYQYFKKMIDRKHYLNI